MDRLGPFASLSLRKLFTMQCSYQIYLLQLLTPSAIFSKTASSLFSYLLYCSKLLFRATQFSSVLIFFLNSACLGFTLSAKVLENHFMFHKDKINLG